MYLKEGDAFSYVPEPKYTDFQQTLKAEGCNWALFGEQTSQIKFKEN